jgi:hypothetical protein
MRSVKAIGLRRFGPVLLLLGSLCATASAYQAGITGYSGKRGETCGDSCHSGGAAPVVFLHAASAAAAGTVVSLELFFEAPRASQFAGGLNVAVADGQLLSGHDVLRIEAGELTHVAPRASSDVNRDGRRTAADLCAWVQLPRGVDPAPCQRGDLNGDLAVDDLDALRIEEAPFAAAALLWSFLWQVPEVPGVYTVHAAVLSANCNGTRSGDESAVLRGSIRVE